jgi:hypothetical protein
VDEKGQTLNLFVEGSTFPNWDVENQKRSLTPIGDELKITNPTASVDGTNYQVWKRASRQSATNRSS